MLTYLIDMYNNRNMEQYWLKQILVGVKQQIFQEKY